MNKISCLFLSFFLFNVLGPLAKYSNIMLCEKDVGFSACCEMFQVWKKLPLQKKKKMKEYITMDNSMLSSEERKSSYLHIKWKNYTPAVNEYLISNWKGARFGLVHGTFACEFLTYNEGSWSQHSVCSDLTLTPVNGNICMQLPSKLNFKLDNS